MLRVASAGLLVAAPAMGIATGCLDRPVAPSEPTTTNIFVEQYVNAVIDKIDLLFMIDNSISMADKQAFFAEAVPQLVNRLVSPICVGIQNPEQVDPAQGANGNCSDPAVYEREFKPINDIHIGVVTSSLGGYTGHTCSDPSDNDAGQLVGSLSRTTSGTNPITNRGVQNLGFLAWDPDGSEGGSTTAAALQEAFQQHVRGAGEQGCGFEASLEAWFRFLIDPAPYSALVKDPNSNWVSAVPEQIDQAVLTQRKAFLREDSLVAVIMLTDENDCSVAVPGFSWLVTDTPDQALRIGNLPRASAACADDPNAECCRSCVQGPASGCPNNEQDAECKKGLYTNVEDPANLRCWEQKRRFGIDVLFPTARYAVGLSKRELCPSSPYNDMDCDCAFATELYGKNAECKPGARVPNPLFTNLQTGGPATRDQTLVYFAGIVGVPWQDIADDASLTDPNRLVYKTSPQLTLQNRWATIVGDIYKYVKPEDPFMHEQMQPRAAGASNPIVTGEKISAPAGGLNNINGTEYNVVTGDDLQYACVFPLPEDRNCDPKTGGVPADVGCDCDEQEKPLEAQSPLCRARNGNTFSMVQTYAKGYPGLRHLDALRRFGDNSIVGSICPKITDPTKKASPAYGYNPAVGAIISRLKEVLGGTCLPRKLIPEEDGSVPCRVVEALPPTNGTCPEVPDREVTRDTEPDLAKAVLAQVREAKRCDGQTGVSCDDVCLYTVRQLPDGPRQECQSSSSTTAGSGYCYVDPEAGLGEEKLVEDCPESQKRLLQFVGENTPQKGALTFIACTGAAFGAVTQVP